MTKKILVVDDSSSMRHLINFTLSQDGYDVVEAIDGKDALSKLEDIAVDLIISDLNMPRLNGLDLIRNVRKSNHRFMPIVMLTTESDPQKKQEGKLAGATAWIVKPFKREQLLFVVSKVLG